MTGHVQLHGGATGHMVEKRPCCLHVRILETIFRRIIGFCRFGLQACSKNKANPNMISRVAKCKRL